MEVYLQDLSTPKRWLYKFAKNSIYPTIIGAIGFAYIAIPSSLQETVRRLIPSFIREHLLLVCSTENWLLIVLGITVLFSILGGAGSHASTALVKKKCRALSEENELLKQERDSKSIDCYKFFSNYLYSYYSNLGLGTSERISLYKLDMSMFSCIGRHSDNEIYKTKPDRLYPRDQGCISKAWEVGVYEDTSAPSSSAKNQDWEQYHAQKYGYSIEQAVKIKMKSRAFYGARITTLQNTTIAVLIFESTDNNGLPIGKIKRLLNNHEKNQLCAILESLSEHIPSLEAARAEGF